MGMKFKRIAWVAVDPDAGEVLASRSSKEYREFIRNGNKADAWDGESLLVAPDRKTAVVLAKKGVPTAIAEQAEPVNRTENGTPLSQKRDTHRFKNGTPGTYILSSYISPYVLNNNIGDVSERGFSKDRYAILHHSILPSLPAKGRLLAVLAMHATSTKSARFPLGVRLWVEAGIYSRATRHRCLQQLVADGVVRVETTPGRPPMVCVHLDHKNRVVPFPAEVVPIHPENPTCEETT